VTGPGRRPRLGRVSPADLSPADAALLAPDGPFPGAAGSNFFATLVHHPGLYRKWVPLGSKLLMAGKLPARDREMLILRTAWQCGCRYEWAHHAGALQAAGATAEQVQAVAAGPGHPVWDHFDRALLRLVDGLHSGQGVDDGTWDTLAGRWTEQELIEAIFVVGMYQTVAGFLLTVGIEIEDGHVLAEELGWPEAGGEWNQSQ
jgi:4-carboxymuconolactone decarboxylase